MTPIVILCDSCKHRTICKYSDQCKKFWKSQEVLDVLGTINDEALPINLSLRCEHYEENVPTIKAPHYRDFYKSEEVPC